MTTEVVKAEQSVAVQQPEGSILAVIARAAADPTVDVAKMTALLDLQERIMARQSEQLFREAMAAFQDECPIIIKSRGVKNKNRVILYHYAPLDEIVAAVKALIKRHGFSYQIKTEFPSPDRVRAICVARHVAGHSEESAVELPLITKTDIMSAPQVVSGTITFASRRAFCNAFGIMTGDSDTDGNHPGKPLTREQIDTIEDLIHQAGMNNPRDRAKFLEFMAFESVAEIAQAAYPPALNFLQAKVRKGAAQ